MKKPIIIWIILIGLCLNGIYQLYAFAKYRELFLLVTILCSFLSAMGLALTKKWSISVIIFLSIVSGALWVGSVREVYKQGWPYADILSSIISLTPGLFYILWWVSIACYVSWYFTVKLKR